MQDNTLTIMTDNGEEILCEILFTTHSDEFKKDYVVFVEKGTSTASAAIYIPSEDGKGQLEQIKSEEEWAMLEEMLDKYAQEHEDSCGGDCSSCSSCEGCSSCSSDEELDETLED